MLELVRVAALVSELEFLILPSGLHGHGEAHGGDGGSLVSAAAAEGGDHAGFGAQLGDYMHTISWADYGCFIGLLLVVAGLTVMNVRRTNLIPLRDPRLSESLNFENF